VKTNGGNTPDVVIERTFTLPAKDNLLLQTDKNLVEAIDS
jgi:hypothetical protein